MTQALQDAVAHAAEGGAPDTIALMRILAEATTESEARRALDEATARAGLADPQRHRLARLRTLWDNHPGAWQAVRGTLEQAVHDRPPETTDEVLAFWTQAFDRLAASHPEASVALYSLGSPDLLAAATDEVVGFLDRQGLLGPDRDGLDYGCGIGRFLVALSPRMRSMRGLDISAGMVAEARRRCASLANVSVEQGDGRAPQSLVPASLTLILAADVFPYLNLAGGSLVGDHLSAFARALRAGGAIVILNYSYEGSFEAHCAEIEALGSRVGLTLAQAQSGVFSTWDAATFVLCHGRAEVGTPESFARLDSDSKRRQA